MFEPLIKEPNTWLSVFEELQKKYEYKLITWMFLKHDVQKIQGNS